MPLLQTATAGEIVHIKTPQGDAATWTAEASVSAGAVINPDSTAVGGSSGDIAVGPNLSTGVSSGAGGSGDIYFRSGDVTVGASGDVAIWPALSSTGGTAAAEVLRRVTTAADGTIGYSAPLFWQVFNAAATQTLVGGTVGIGEFLFGDQDFSLPVDLLQDGATIRFRALATILNFATSTITLRVRLGGVAGDILAETAAVVPADDDVFMIDGVMTVRFDGAGGTMLSAALTSADTLVAAANMEPYVLQATAINTETAITIGVTAQFSAADTDVRLDTFTVSLATSG